MGEPILYQLAAYRIPIDLDDGVLVNYTRFGKAIKNHRTQRRRHPKEGKSVRQGGYG